MLSASAVASAVAGRLDSIRETQDEWDAVTEVVQAEIAPRVATEGAEAVLAALVQGKNDPFVAAVLVDVSGVSDVPLASSGREFFRINEVFTDDEIVGAAVEYLDNLPGSGLSDGEWAWTALWNGWRQLDEDAHLRLVCKLIERAPDSDEVLALIADGPVRELIECGKREELEGLAGSDTRIVRVLGLMPKR